MPLYYHECECGETLVEYRAISEQNAQVDAQNKALGK